MPGNHYHNDLALFLAWTRQLLLLLCGLSCFAPLAYAAADIDLSGLPDNGSSPESGLPPANADEKDKPKWLKLAPGLEFGEFRLNQGDSPLAVLRIDPESFDFVLCTDSQEGTGPATLQEWAANKELSAAINASMYLPDNRTSTGYMRSGEHINNGRIMERFGAFFVAGPRKKGIPRARIIDRDQPDWRESLDDYDIVIQNYRMTNSQRRILWSTGGPLYSISAIAQDGNGKILFLHSRKPIEAYTFVQQLLHLPLDARTIMYVEGGGQAGMVINYGGLKRDLSGIHAPSLLITGNLKAALPNILGIRPRPAH